MSGTFDMIMSHRLKTKDQSFASYIEKGRQNCWKVEELKT